MLRSLKNLEHYTVTATDGEIGTVVNFLLDEESWTIRYLVVEAHCGFLNERRVLISPISFRQVDWLTYRFHVALTMDKVKNSPSVDTDKPVSRQHERDYYGYYGYPYYWGYGGLWREGGYPRSIAINSTASEEQSDDVTGDVHLRSASELRGYHIQGTDAAIGHVDDFIIDDVTWEVRYLAIDTSNWWFGKKVLVAPHWASQVSWEAHKVYVDMSRQAIKSSPEWDPTAAVNREYEARLYDYYGRPAYWSPGRSQESQTPQTPTQHSSSHIVGR